MKKKPRLLFLILLIICTLCIPASADNDANIDSGEGGNLNAGTSENHWNGDDGIRITVLRVSDVSAVAYLDWTNYNESGVEQCFVKRSKLDYLRGYGLDVSFDTYQSFVPPIRLPKIVSESGNNVNAIKQYFNDTGHLEIIAAQAGLTYEELISGDYKLLLEPMVYFFLMGSKYAMTATEAALYDIQVNGAVYSRMPSLTHRNLPLSMFLERNDDVLPLYAWTGATSGRQSNLDIINYLGIGIISFAPQEEEPEVDHDGVDYTFRCDTDVIVSFPIHNSGAAVTPDDNAYVTLTVGDTTYHRQYVCPAGGTQLIWVRWHTPDTPQDITMTATGAGDSVILTARIETLEEKTPPDPTFYDSNSSFSLADLPDYGSNLHTTWGEWFAEWVQESGEHLGGYSPIYGEPDPETGTTPIVGYAPWYYTCEGYCQEHGHWEWEYVTYSASLYVSFSLEPDDRCQTDYESNRYGTVMASGYGVQATVTASTLRSGGADIYDVTPVQNVLATFPEFEYGTYTRLLEHTQGAKWQFQSNPCSYYGSRIHYTPLWYPDDTYYPVSVCVFDVWTPGGQLYACLSDQVYIFQSCLDDWYIHIVE